MENNDDLYISSKSHLMLGAEPAGEQCDASAGEERVLGRRGQ